MMYCKFFFSAAVLASTAFAQSTLSPGTVNYTIEQSGKKLGAASYTIEAQPNKYVVTSNGKMAEGKFSYAFSNTQKLDTSLNLITDQLSGVVSGKAVSFNATSDPSGRQFNLNISANGTEKTNAVDRDQNTALLTDLDPAGYMLLAQIAMRNPSDAWGLVPKENGFLVPVKFTPQPDQQGRLNGHLIPVKYVSAAISTQNAVTIELFYSPDGHLLEADLPQQNFYVIRDGFQLTHRPKPPAPPHGQAPPQQDQQQATPPQQPQSQQ